MRYRILLRGAELCGCALRSRRQEHRVVAESAVTARLSHDGARPLTAHHDFACDPTPVRMPTRTPRRAARRAHHPIAPTTTPCWPGRRRGRPTTAPTALPACRSTPPPRGRVVGHRRQPRRAKCIARLRQGVLLECRARLRRLVKRRDVIERQQRQPRDSRGVEHAVQLGQLLAIATGDQVNRSGLNPL